MSRASDTLWVLADSGSRTATVKRFTLTDYEKEQLPVPLSATEDALLAVDTCTVQVQPRRDTFEKGGRGEVAEHDSVVYFPLTSTVAVGDWLFLDGDEDYQEVVGLDEYEDHKRAYARKVEGR